MSQNKNMNVTLKIWRQKDTHSQGSFETYEMKNVSPNSSFLEMMDLLNDDLTKKGIMPVEFESDCREGICGSCSCVINGQAHGPVRGATTCQVYMRQFHEGETITVEPFRAKAFPVIRDLVVDREALDNIIASGGYTGNKVGPHADANAILIPKDNAEKSMDAAACIGCGACVAACPNASASLFTAAKITQLALLPQGQPLRDERVIRMVETMDESGFGHCTNIGECRNSCPKEIKLDVIAWMKRDYFKAMIKA
jgi:succinate dehydrogenase / fumarate reductase iron-sulfur subunit